MSQISVIYAPGSEWYGIFVITCNKLISNNIMFITECVQMFYSQGNEY